MPEGKKDGNLVFVYGTLMKGQRAHLYLAEAEYLGEYWLSGYAMYDLGWYPGIVPDPGRTVYGEVYRVSDQMLWEMDRYEGEGSLYYRIRVNAKNDAEMIKTFVYVYAKRPIKGLIQDGKWNEYKYPLQ